MTTRAPYIGPVDRAVRSGVEYACVQCHQPLPIPDGGAGTWRCGRCGFEYEYGDRYLRYDFDRLLYAKFRKPYLLWKILGNNGYIAYQFLREGSLSLPGRNDVANFREYIVSRLQSGKILDIGCGVLEVPGYLDFDDKSGYEFYGLDPIDDRSFMGVRITGCSEFTPFPNDTFDAMVFATSLDHMCSLPNTIAESYRILRPGGKILVWMSDRTKAFALARGAQAVVRLLRSTLDAARAGGGTRLSGWKRGVTFLLRRMLVRVARWAIAVLRVKRHGFISKRFVVYPNLTVLYTPHGAVDPFHTFFEGPKELVQLMKRAGFRHDDTLYNNRNEIFLAFTKTEP